MACPCGFSVDIIDEDCRSRLKEKKKKKKEKCKTAGM